MEPSPKTVPAIGLAALAIVSLVWGISWPANKCALAEIQPWTYRSLGMLISGGTILILARLKGLSLKISRAQFMPLCLTAFFNMTCWHLLSAYGIKLMPAGRAAILAYSMPIWGAIIGVFLLKEPMNLRRLVGLVLGMAGLAVLIGPDLKALGSVPLGAACMLGGAFCWALGTVLSKRFHWSLPALLMAGWQLLLGSPPVILGALVLEDVTAVLHVSWLAIGAMFYIALGSILIGYWGWFKALEILPAGLASLGVISVPVLGVFSSSLMLGESIGLQEIAALILVSLALFTVLRGPGRPGRRAKIRERGA